MEIKLYNTLTRKKEIFKPIKKGFVGIYTCGPTVYSHQHIGNLRSYFFPDILKKIFIINGYKVKHIINVTDVGHLTSDADEGEDKMENAAKKEGKSAKEISEFYFNLFKKDLKKMNILSPTLWTKATEHINEQIEIIKKLEKKGFIYKTSDGIYFNTSKLKDYGKLFGLNVKGIKQGKRISIKEKKNKTDFALWKFSSIKDKRQQEWDSPWGKGFPGWHIECSAMSIKHLGETFDIHTGGQEHIQIHHTNEIAQSESATGKKFVNYWLHGEWLTSKGEKISKSKGGLYTLSEIEKKGYSPLDLKYFFLSAHYKKPLEFSFNALENSKNSLKRLKNIISEFKKENKKKNEKNIDLTYKQFLKIISDNIDYPKALAYMWEIIRDEKLNETEKYHLVLKFDKIFCLNLDEGQEIKIDEKIKKLLEKREFFRKQKNFEEADKIRDEIKKLGFVVEDKKNFSLRKI